MEHVPVAAVRSPRPVTAKDCPDATTSPPVRAHALTAPRAWAEPPRITAEAGTDVPVSMSAGARAELPGRIQLATSIGILPDAYVQSINDMAVSAARRESVCRL